jgi:hypothetical protein
MAKHCEIAARPLFTAGSTAMQTTSDRAASSRIFNGFARSFNGGIRRIRVCTRCIRSNKVVKAAVKAGDYLLALSTAKPLLFF